MNSGQIISIIAAVIGVVVIVLGVLSQRKLEAVRGTETVSIGSLGSLPPGNGQTCEIKGVAEPGPHGQLKGPMSGQPCVWFHTKVEEHWRTVHYNNGRRSTSSHSRTLQENGSPPQISVRDQTGVALLDFNGTKVDSPVQSFHNRRPATPDNVAGFVIEFLSDKHDHYLEFTEVLVPPGQPIYALGKGGPHPATGAVSLVKPDSGPFIVSTKSEEEFSKSTRTKMLLEYVIGGVLFLGGGIAYAVMALT